MATYNVSTMQQFINALSSLTDEDVIDIQNDLDYNEIVDDMTEPLRVPSTGFATNCTINGNNHAIYNLDNTRIMHGTYSSFFNVYAQHMRVNNLSMLNVNMTKAGRIFDFTVSNSNTDNRFTGGVIQGRFYKGVPFVGDSLEIHNYMITFNNSQCSYGSVSNCKWFYCWINFDRCLADGNSAYWSNATGCYFQGTISADSRTIVRFSLIDNCCINIVMGNAAPYASWANFMTYTGPMVTIVNSTKLNFENPLPDTDTIKSVTDEQMHDAEYLASIGFDIAI